MEESNSEEKSLDLSIPFTEDIIPLVPEIVVQSSPLEVISTESKPPADTAEVNLEDPTEGLSEEVKLHYEKLAKIMFMFPSSLLREINGLIDSGTIRTAARLQEVVKDRYKGSLKIPSRTTFRAYVVYRLKQKMVLDKAKQALSETPDLSSNKPEPMGTSSKSIYQDLTLSVENKKTLLENLIQLCERRIQAIKTIQENDPTSSYEGVLSSYVREVRAITETLIKLRTELKNEGEKEIEIYVNNKLASVIRSTIQAYTSIHGKDKVDLFRTALKFKLKDNRLEDLSTNSSF